MADYIRKISLEGFSYKLILGNIFKPNVTAILKEKGYYATLSYSHLIQTNYVMISPLSPSTIPARLLIVPGLITSYSPILCPSHEFFYFHYDFLYWFANDFLGKMTFEFKLSIRQDDILSYSPLVRDLFANALHLVDDKGENITIFRDSYTNLRVLGEENGFRFRIKFIGSSGYKHFVEMSFDGRKVLEFQLNDNAVPDKVLYIYESIKSFTRHFDHITFNIPFIADGLSSETVIHFVSYVIRGVK